MVKFGKLLDRSLTPFANAPIFRNGSDLQAQIQALMWDQRITPPDHIVLNGKHHRFNIGIKKTITNGWYILSDTGSIVASALGDWNGLRKLSSGQILGGSFPEVNKCK